LGPVGPGLTFGNTRNAGEILGAVTSLTAVFSCPLDNINPDF